MSAEIPDKLSDQKQLKPGKWYGIIALLCGLESFLVLLFLMLLELFGIDFYQSPRREIGMVLGSTWAPCAIAAFVFGIMGRKTEGKHYANIGIVFSLLCGALVLFMLGFAYVWFVVLGHPT